MFSQTQQSYSMLFIDLGRHVSIPLDSSSGPLFKIQIHYIELLKHVLGSQTFTTNLCSQYICLCFLTIRSGYLFLDSKNIKTLLCVCVTLFLWLCIYKMLLITIIKNCYNCSIITLGTCCHPYASVLLLVKCLAVWIVLLTLELSLY